jgi:tripartite-type tricarboxylate transporter receptor subunit TctC
MGHMLPRVLSGAIAAAALGLAAGAAAAQTDYPQRAITLIVPFAAGGPTTSLPALPATT